MRRRPPRGSTRSSGRRAGRSARCGTRRTTTRPRDHQPWGGRATRRTKRKTRAEKRAPAKDAGPGWYGLPRADATVSADDRAALALRGVADPKRHYKRQDAPSEFAALGTVVAGKFDGASGTLKKRERKTGLMGELLADSGARSYAKRRFTAVQERQRGPGLSTLKQKRKTLARRKKGR